MLYIVLCLNSLTIVDVSVNVMESTSTVGNIVFPVTLVFGAIRPDLDTYKYEY
jgi:hypothetical protein